MSDLTENNPWTWLEYMSFYRRPAWKEKTNPEDDWEPMPVYIRSDWERIRGFSSARENIR